MNCPTADKLSQYADQMLSEQEMMDIRNHMKNCRDCRHIVQFFQEEEQILTETLQAPALPDHFASLVLEQLEPYETKSKSRKRWKPMMSIAAGVVLAVGLSATLNPGFAQWIGGLFSTEQVDEGLRMASNAGLAKRVNKEVTDQGLTLKIEDVVADSSRVALSYQILNENGQPQDSYLDLAESNNKITAVDQTGKTMDGVGMGWSEGSDYGLIEFSLRQQENVENISVRFELVELNGKKGSWTLEIPVDLKESLKQTTTLPLSGADTSAHGVVVRMKEARFAPSSHELLYETSFTKEEQARMEKEIQQLEKQFGKENTNTFTNYGAAIQYHIENEQQQSVYHHNAFLEGKGHPSDVGVLQGTGQLLEQLGQTLWNESFIPQKSEDKLTFVLDGVIKTVPSDFSVQIKLKELKKHPVSFEYEGNVMTIKKAEKKNQYSLQKSMLPIKKETIFKVEMEGGKEAGSVDFGTWVIADENGKVYPAYHSGSILDEKDENGRYKTTINLTSYDVDEAPEQLTLHLLSETRYEEVKEKWRVPLYNE
jgi:hypothetical protein